MKNMKNLIFAVFSAVFCLACEKDNFTMPQTDMAGTYWVEDREVYTGYSNGKYFSVDTDKERPIGSNFNILYFSESGKMSTYVHMLPDEYFYRTSAYVYDETRRIFEINGVIHKLIRLTPEQFVWSYKVDTPSEQMSYTIYHKRIEPDEEWLEGLSRYEDRTEEK